MINEFRPMNHLTSLQNFICTIGNLPTSYTLSLSYEEQIWWLCDFLEKKVFPAIEENTNITEETQQAFIDLQNYVSDYFNNLDVQEEINNKLDEMAESGILTEIISTYLNTKALLCFDTVTDMKNSVNLINGSFAKTLGYHSKNDGGSAIYKIREITNTDVIDNGLLIPLNTSNTLIAELQNNKNNIVCFGAYNNQQISSSLAIQNCIEYNKGKEVIFPSGHFYITEPIKTYQSKDNFTNLIMKTDTIISALDPVSCILDIGGIDETFPYEVGYKKFVTGGKLIATSNVTNCVIKIEQNVKDLELSHLFAIYNNCDGLIIGDNNSSSQDCYIHHVNLEHSNVANENSGLIVNSNDNHISDCRIYYNKKAVVNNVGGTFYNNIHTLANNLQNDSVSFTTSKNMFMSNCYGDSEDIFIKVISSQQNTPRIIMTNCEYYSYRTNKMTVFDIDYACRLKITNLFVYLKEGNEHIGIRCPYDALRTQLSQEFLDCNGITIENAEYMRNGDIFKGLTVHEKGKTCFDQQYSGKTMTKDVWYLLGYFTASVRVFNNFEITLSNRKSIYPIKVTSNTQKNFSIDIGVAKANTEDPASYEIGYKLINPDYDVSSDYPRIAVFFKVTSNQTRFIEDYKIFGSDLIPLSTETNRPTTDLQTTETEPDVKYSINGSDKTISLIN